MVVQRAMQEGVRNGRNGLGSIYVFASGNGRRYGDDCNFDGYANSIYSITIGAVDHTGQQPSRPEKKYTLHLYKNIRPRATSAKVSNAAEYQKPWTSQTPRRDQGDS